METRKHIVISTALAVSVSGSALATVIGNQVFGDSYLVTDGAKTYAVLDVYLKSVNNTQDDRISQVFGNNAYKSSFVLQQRVGTGPASSSGVSLRQHGGSAWRPSHTGGTSRGDVAMPDGVTYGLYDHTWDSFVTLGLRYQSNDGGGTSAIQATPTFFTNFGTANAASIAGDTAGTKGGAGWYSLAGGTAATNPFCRVGFYNGQGGPLNVAKATDNIVGNGITAGQSLDNHFMIGRFAIDTADMQAGVTYSYAMKFGIVCVSDGLQRTGATDTSYRVDQGLTFVPAPGAVALIGLAGVLGRRRV